jgi:hypothetical protein
MSEFKPRARAPSIIQRAAAMSAGSATILPIGAICADAPVIAAAAMTSSTASRLLLDAGTGPKWRICRWQGTPSAAASSKRRNTSKREAPGTYATPNPIPTAPALRACRAITIIESSCTGVAGAYGSVTPAALRNAPCTTVVP